MIPSNHQSAAGTTRSHSTLFRLCFSCLVFLTYSMSVFSVVAQEPDNRRGTERWHDSMEQFAEADRKSLHHDVVFTGSSSIRLWDLEESFGGKIDGINRGFGGSIINDNIHFLPQTVFPYTPRVVVLYAGDNDIGIGMEVAEVVADYQRFCEQLHHKFPETRLIYVAIKPSLARWEMWPDMKSANDQIQALTEKSDWQYFADIAPVMLGDDGKPRPELFVEDGLHMNKAGYQTWDRIMLPLLQKALHTKSLSADTKAVDVPSDN